MMERWKESAAVMSCCLLVGVMVLLAGCSSSRTTETTIHSTRENPTVTKNEPPPPPPSPSADRTYTYRVINDDCNCSDYHTADPDYPVSYRIHADYRMESGLLAHIVIEVDNKAKDTVYLGQGTVRVSSLNMSFQYNNRFVALPAMTIPPGKSEEVKLSGKEITGENNWHKIAGEQMTLTIKGLLLGNNELQTQKITFVPENPYLENPHFESGGY